MLVCQLICLGQPTLQLSSVRVDSDPGLAKGETCSKSF